jgi:hypothetical protein
MAIIPATPTGQRIDMLFPAAGPSPPDLGIHVIVKQEPAICPVCSLIRVPIWDRLAIELDRHCNTYSPHVDWARQKGGRSSGPGE